ncbi:MAG TPA: hypothetical protein VEG34_06250 [Thermoanaerobaculia bacterium]|nr:hypothetical protein [Thermoanaerobaculia bacterium]
MTASQRFILSSPVGVVRLSTRIVEALHLVEALIRLPVSLARVNAAAAPGRSPRSAGSSSPARRPEPGLERVAGPSRRGHPFRLDGTGARPPIRRRRAPRRNQR